MRKTALLTSFLILVIASSLSAAQKRRAVRHPEPAPLPLAADDSYSATQGTSLVVFAPGVLTNDTLNGGAIASYGATTGTEHTTLGTNTTTAQGGAVTLLSTGDLFYFAGTGFTGTDTFRYVLSNSRGTATARVNITVLPAPPIAADDTFSTQPNTALLISAPGVLGNDSLNGATLVSYGAAAGTEQSTLGATTPTASNGTVRANADGSFRYDPATGFNGSDRFKYVVRNTGGSATATATITIQSAAPQTFNVTSPGFFFAFSGLQGENPELTLTRGRTYIFHINTDPIHPFQILSAPPGSVTNNNISDGEITFVVPTAAASYRYDCSIHGFGNTINTVP